MYGCATIILELFFLSCRHLLPLVFTPISEIDELIARALLILCVYLIFDGLQTILGFLLKGMGMQKQACIGNIISFICIYFITALHLAFYTFLEFYGLWIGFATSCLSAATFYTIVYLRTDWIELFKKIDIEIQIKI